MKRLTLIIPMFTLVLVLFAVGCSFLVLSEAKLANNDGFDSSDLGLYAEAISHYDKAIQLDPDFADAYNKRGFAYYHGVGHEQRAIRDIDKAIQLDPGYVMALCGSWRCLQDVGLVPACHTSMETGGFRSGLSW